MKAWMRDLQIILTSETLGKTVIFGNKDVNLSIDVDGVKYLSSLKDNFSIRISNLTYSEIIELIRGQFYNVEIKAGYKSLGGGKTVFKGGVLYISNELGEKKTNTAIILCTSDVVAKYGQKRMNLTLRSGINLYSALKFLCRRAGMSKSNISNDFRYKFLTDGLTGNKTVGSFFDSIANDLGLAVNTDASNGGSITSWNPFTTDRRVINVSKDNFIFTGSYPRINSEGVKVTLLPTFNIMPGDVIVIDNAWLDISAGNRDEVFKNNAMYLDTDGEYMVYQVAYKLQNRSSQFQIELLCKSRHLIKQTMGGK